MKTRTIALLVSASMLGSLSACGYIKSLFPDKEKDYQYTTEIPPLILPADLNNSLIPNARVSASSTQRTGAVDTVSTVSESPTSFVSPASNPGTASPPPDNTDSSALPESEAELPDTAITLEQVKLANGENRLRLKAPFARSWRIVSKALSRKSIEVTERNQEAKLFTVQYDPEERKVEDGSYLDELVFMFKGIQNNEKTYLIKLEENNQQTDIVIVDEDQQLLLDAGSNKLLTLLEETIKADLANK